MKTTSALFALACCLASLPAGAAPRPPRPTPPVGDPVQAGVWRLHGTDPGLPHDDLAPLQQLIGTATLVGLGETIHTSGGFYEMKHRLIRYLVQNAGFRVVAWESPWVGFDRIAAYVETCSGTPEEAMKRNLFGVWASAETRDLFAWMCEWNRSHRKAADKVHLMGFDVQDFYGQNPTTAPALRAFLERIGIGPEDPRNAGLDACDGVTRTEIYGLIPGERFTACLAALDALDQHFATQAKPIARRTSKKDLALAKVYTAGLRAWEGQANYGNSFQALHWRDRGMAYVLPNLLEIRYPKAKAIVWAHNSHLGENNTDVIPPDVDWMGSYLSRTLGAKYFTVALAALGTDVDWPGIGCGHRNDMGKPGSIEERLHDLGEGDLLVAVDQPGIVPDLIPEGFRLLGSSFLKVDQDFDALVYLEHSRSMLPLDWPSCWGEGGPGGF
jgi:erythromycin esterase-like protein